MIQAESCVFWKKQKKNYFKKTPLGVSFSNSSAIPQEGMAVPISGASLANIFVPYQSAQLEASAVWEAQHHLSLLLPLKGLRKGNNGIWQLFPSVKGSRVAIKDHSYSWVLPLYRASPFFSHQFWSPPSFPVRGLHLFCWDSFLPF